MSEPPKPPIVFMQGTLDIGRPPTVIKGAPIRTIMAHPLVLSFPEAGEYVARVRLTGRPPSPLTERTESFEVVDVPVVVVPPQQ